MRQKNEQGDRSGLRSIVVVVCAATAIVAGCSTTGDSSPESSTTVPTTNPTSTGPGPTADVDQRNNVALCALANEMSAQESLPTAAQLARYRELAPPEIAGATNTATAALGAAGDDMVKFNIAFADDDVEKAIAEIHAWETKECGIDHSDGPSAPLEGGATRTKEDGVTTVAITATDYSFRLGRQVMSPGRTSLVLTNNGLEAHFMLLFKMVDGVTMEQVMASENGGEGLIEGSWVSGFAAPGGADEEVLSLDLEPGTYGLACYISARSGTPHAVLGMTAQFTVR